MSSVRANVRTLRPNGAPASPPKTWIVEETVALCTQVYKNRLRALVLTGSVARDEGTFVTATEGLTLLGDAEFLAVFHDALPLPADGDLTVLEGKIHERLRRRGLVATVSLGGVQGRYFRGIRPSIFGFELGACGSVVWGDPDVLRLIPPFAAADIPLEDGWRLLANRLVEQLESFDELASGRPVLSVDAHYRTVKLYLDMATSLLVFAGRYAPTYGRRADALAALAAAGEVPSFPLEAFARDVLAATRWKLRSRVPNVSSPREFWRRAVEHAERLWHWELSRLTGNSADHADGRLLDAWLARQRWTDRLRGWAHVARREGVATSLVRGPRWLRAAMTASPRYHVYAVAVPLVFALSPADASRHDDPLAAGAPASASRHLAWLPDGGAADDRGARDAARTVLDNYRRFLVGTRA